MDFQFTTEQTLFKESVDRFIADAYGFERRMALAASEEGFSREHWRDMAELGWFGVAFSEEHGGFGGSAVETMILMEAFGRGLVLEPFVPTVVLGGTALAHGATSRAHRDVLASVIEGDTLLSLAYAEAGSRYDYGFVETSARRDGADLLVRGAKRSVPFAAAADKLVVSVRTSGLPGDARGITLVLVDRDASGIARDDFRTVDGHRASDIVFDDVRVGSGDVLGVVDDGLALLDVAIDAGIGALCAEAVGTMSVMQRMTLEYLKTREQFGVAIGSFQALQHRAVDMLIELELARSMCLFGTVALAGDASRSERAKALSATKVQVARSGRIVGQSAIQLHGGIGMSEEYAVGHYFKRMSMLELALGDVDYHLDRYLHAAATIGDTLAVAPRALETV